VAGVSDQKSLGNGYFPVNICIDITEVVKHVDPNGLDWIKLSTPKMAGGM
jgi:hypothetical protein